MKTVLFVCSGNTCRSPMAEAIFNDAIDDHPRLTDVRAISAGTFACEGADMAEYAEEVLEEMGVKRSFLRHKATPFTEELAENADLILAMQEQHLEEIDALAPDTEGKAHTIKGFASGVDGFTGSEDYDIDDPFGCPLEVYEEVGEELKKQIALVIERLDREWGAQ